MPAASALRACDASEHALDAFGYTVSNRHIGAVLWQALRARARVELPARRACARCSSETTRCALRVADAAGVERAVDARLVVAADGAHSLVRQAAGIAESSSDYGQVAVVANVRTDRPSAGHRL